MQTGGQKRLQIRTGKKAGIWLSLAFALALHVVFILLPVVRHLSPSPPPVTTIELQLTTTSVPDAPEVSPEPEVLPPEPEPAQIPEPLDVQAALVLEEPPTPVPVADELPRQSDSPVARKSRPDLYAMSEPEKRQLTSDILIRQYFTEETAADQLFGKPLPQQNTEIRKEFHYPSKPNMMTILDQHMPDVPFAYTPDLIYFAYDPGVKGDLQRFWDVITPEFGWRTKYGTEVRCKLVLVIIGCGWK